MKTIKSLLVLLAFIGFSDQYTFAQNVEISRSNFPNEPAINMDPKNPNILVAAANLNNYYLSKDGGKTWTTHTLSSSYGVWGDPVIEVDTASNFYFFHLSNPANGTLIDRIVAQKSTDNGKTWSDGTFTGLNGKEHDKHWTVVDRSNNNIYMTWTQFDVYGSSNPLHRTIILFSKSTDGGNSWSAPVRISKNSGDAVDSDNTVEGAVPAVGPNGEIYVAWAGPQGLVFNRSTDQGETWLEEELFVTSIPGGWDYNIPGIFRSNGLPITKCDLSGGPNHGTIYINWSDQRNGTHNTDIWLVKSTDGGNTWSGPRKVNDDSSAKHQFLTWMDIDQKHGDLHFVFYDRRDHFGEDTEVYLAHSADGGETFTNEKISESPFTPTDGVFFGDYTNIVAHDSIVRPIWTRLHNAHLSIWTHIPRTGVVTGLTAEIPVATAEEIKQYPNPISNDISYVSFKLPVLSNVELAIYDQQGKLIQWVINNEQMGYGKHVIPIDLKKFNLPPGTYLHKLFINGKAKTIKTLIVK